MSVRDEIHVQIVGGLAGAKFPIRTPEQPGFRYLPFDSEGAHCFLQLVSKRYEKTSIIFTSNKSYGDWGDQ